MDTIVVVNDIHIPYENKQALDVVNSTIHYLQPDTIVYLGDVCDFAGLTSKFRILPTQRQHLRRDLDVGRALLTLHHTTAPKARQIYIEGNHEARLRNYVVDTADELATFTDDAGILSLPSLMGLRDIGVEYRGPYGEVWEYNSFLFKHGDHITKYAAAAELMSEGSSGISGHTHRLGSYYITNRSGAHAWYENGCLCHTVGWNRPPSTTEKNGPYNWQNGFAIVRFSDRIFNVNQVVVTDGKCIVEGRQLGG